MKDLNDIGKKEIEMRKVRKRDALRIALRSLKLPKLRESEKLFYAGLIVLVMSIAFAAILTELTQNLILGLLLFIVGFLICRWFTEASDVMEKWEEWETEEK